MQCQAYLIDARIGDDSREGVDSEGGEDGRFDADPLFGKEFKECD
jgi:hypothetical protein